MAAGANEYCRSCKALPPGKANVTSFWWATNASSSQVHLSQISAHAKQVTLPGWTTKSAEGNQKKQKGFKVFKLVWGGRLSYLTGLPP